MNLLPFIAALLPLYRLRFDVLGLPTNLIEIATSCVVIAGLITPAVRTRWVTTLTRLPRPLILLTALFLLAAVVSTVISNEPRVSLGILKGWIIVPIIIGFMVYAAPRQAREQLIIVLLSTGVAVALLSLSQLGSHSRLAGIYDVPASLALWLAPLLALALWRSVTLTAERHWLWLSLPMIAALLGTQSLTAIAALLTALAVGALLWAPARLRQRLIGSLLGVALAAALILTATGKTQYLFKPLQDATATSSLSVRLQLWSVSLDLIKQNPVVGVSLGQFEPHYQEALHQRFIKWEQCKEFENCKIGYPLKIENWKLKIQTQPLAEFVYRDPHNLILSLWLNTGLLGLLAFAAIHIYLFQKSRLSQNKHAIHQQATMLALLTLLIAGLAETVYWKNDLAALHWTLLGMLCTYQSKELLLRQAA